jgi:hypothetical protein
MKAACMILAAAVLPVGQSADRKTTPAIAAAKATAPPGKPDTWERSKECALQAEKVMKDRGTIQSWENHYSPKYARCFMSVLNTLPGEGAGKVYALLRNDLLDAFERATLATWSSEFSEKRADDPVACQVDHQAADCATAARFISEHMKN